MRRKFHTKKWREKNEEIKLKLERDGNTVHTRREREIETIERA